MRKLYPLVILVLFCAGCKKKQVEEDRPQSGMFAGKSVEDWEAELRSGDKAGAGLAASAAYAWGPEAVPLVPALAAIPSDWPINTHPVYEQMGEAAVPFLLELLGSDNSETVHRAIRVLLALTTNKQLGAKAQNVSVGLRPFLKSTDKMQRTNAARVLIRIDLDEPGAKEAIIATLHDRDLVVFYKTQIIDDFKVLGKRAVPSLVDAVRRAGSYDARQLPEEVAYQLIPDSAPVYFELLRRASLDQAGLRADYADNYGELFARCGPDATKELIPELLKLARKKDGTVWTAALTALGMLKVETARTLTLEVLQSPSAWRPGIAGSSLRTSAYKALDDPAVVPFAIEEWKKYPPKNASTSETAWVSSIIPLTKHGESKREEILTMARPHLASLYPAGRYAAAVLVRRFDPDAPEPYEIWVTSFGSHIWGAGRNQLDEVMRADKAGTLKHAREYLRHTNAAYHINAAYAILGLDPDDAEAAQKWLDTVQSNNDYRAHIGSFSVFKEPARSRVADLLSHPDAGVRTSAAYIIRKMDPKPTRVVAALEAHYRKQKSGDEGAECVLALESLGLEAKSAAPALRESLADPDPVIRFRAAAALVSIDPDKSLSAVLTEFANPANREKYQAVSAYLERFYGRGGAVPAPANTGRLTRLPPVQPWVPHHLEVSEAAAELLYVVDGEAAVKAGIVHPDIVYRQR